MDSDTRKRKRESDSDSDLYYILHDLDLLPHVDLNYKRCSNSAVLIMTTLFIKNEIKNQMKLKN